MSDDIPAEVGPRFDIGIVSPTHGNWGFAVKPGTYARSQQLVKRQDVVGALQQAFADRDILFWTRFGQYDWSHGEGQDVADDASKYFVGHEVDIHVPGELGLSDNPTVVATVAAALLGRGGCIVSYDGSGGEIFFPWSTGLYTHQQGNNVAGVWATKTTPAGYTLDIVTDGTLAYLCGTYTGVWKSAVPPANSTQFDSGGNGPYRRLAYNVLTKKLYGVTAAALHLINSGGAPTVIFDFVAGHLDALEYHNGVIVFAWNAGYAIDGASTSQIYQYDGTNITLLAEIPGPATILEMVSYGGGLYLSVEFVNTLHDASSTFVIFAYSLIDGVLTQLNPSFHPLDGTVGNSSGNLSDIGPANFIFGAGGFVYFLGSGHLWRHDPVNGGLSQTFGDQAVPSATALTGAVAVFGSIISVIYGTAAGAVWRLTSGADDSQSVLSGARQLTGSRWDINLPYVDKYWDSFEIVLDPLPVGSTVTMEYSLDDRNTWNTCTSTADRPNPITVTNTARASFNIRAVSPIINYRITLAAPVAGGRSPVIHAISARFVPSNPDLKMWTFTITCRDNARLRNNQVSDQLGQDMLDYLFNIAQQSEVVTFYDANERLGTSAARTPHNAWVMSARQLTANTSNVYKQDVQEGDVEIVLWETSLSS